MAISLPSPRSRSASSAACPPAPNVQSTTVCPGRGARAARTSSARTGTWSVSVGKTLGNILRAPFDLFQLLPPFGAIPDLEVVVDARDRDLAPDACALEGPGRDHAAARLVEVGRGPVGEEVPLHPPGLDAERVEARDAVGEPVPVAARVDVETPVHPARDDDLLAELLAEL